MKSVKENNNQSNMIKVTFKKVVELMSALNQMDAGRLDRLSVFIDKLRNNLKPVLESYTKQIGEIDQECCSVDENGNFFTDEKQNPIFSKFSKDGMKKRQVAIDKLLIKEVEIQKAICHDLSRVKTLHISFITSLNGYLFDITTEQIEALYVEDLQVSPNKN